MSSPSHSDWLEDGSMNQVEPVRCCEALSETPKSRQDVLSHGQPAASVCGGCGERFSERGANRAKKKKDEVKIGYICTMDQALSKLNLFLQYLILKGFCA